MSFRDLTNALMQKCVSIDVEDGFGWTPLRWAVWAGNVEMARFLILDGSDLCRLSYDGFTPYSGHLVKLWPLLDAILTSRLLTPLALILVLYEANFVVTLLKRGPPLNSNIDVLKL